MTDHNVAATDTKPLFAATLTPHRSLSPTGFVIFMALVGAASFIAGIAFLIHGAWPVFGFLGLDVAAIYVAFRLNYRSGRAFEEIEMTREQLVVRQVTPAGRAREFSFNPYWTKLLIERHPEWGITRLVLACRNERLSIGGFLNPDDRDSFGKAFTAALAMARSSAAG